MNFISSTTGNDTPQNQHANSVEFIKVEASDVNELENEYLVHPYNFDSDTAVVKVENVEATAEHMTTNEDNAAGDNLDADIDAFIVEHSTCNMMCTEKFAKSEIISFVNESREMDETINGYNRLNTLLLAIIRVIHSQTSVCRNANRSRVYASYQMHGTPVCHKFFLKVHACEESRWSSLLAIYKNEGLVEKKHGNSKRKPYHSLQLSDIDYIETFIRNYAAKNDFAPPIDFAAQNAPFTAGQVARIQKIKKILPPGVRKSTLYRRYVKTCFDRKPVSLSSFKRIWTSRCDDIILQYW